MDTHEDDRVTVLVVTYRGRAFIEACLDSLAAQTIPHRVLVIDNASTDGTAKFLADRFPQVQSLRLPANAGFAGGVAAGLEAVATPWCALLNDDAVAHPGWLDELMSAVVGRPEVAAATSRMLLAPSDEVTSAGPADDPSTWVMNNLGVALNRHGFGYDIGLGLPAQRGFTRAQPVFGFSGGASIVRVSAIRQAGGFASHFFLYYEDTDLSWRLRLLGYDIVSVPSATVWHRHSATVKNTSELFHFHNERNRLLMLLRCATTPFAVSEVLHFLLTTLSLTVKRAVRWPVPGAANARPGLRLRVVADVLRRLRPTLRQRRSIQKSALVPTAVLQAQWVGFDPLGVNRGGSAPTVPAVSKAAESQPGLSGSALSDPAVSEPAGSETALPERALSVSALSVSALSGSALSGPSLTPLAREAQPAPSARLTRATQRLRRLPVRVT